MANCPRCQKDFKKEEGTKLLTGEFVHDWCRTGEEHLEQMLGCRLKEAEMAIEANSTAWWKVCEAIEETKEEIKRTKTRQEVERLETRLTYLQLALQGY